MPGSLPAPARRQARPRPASAVPVPDAGEVLVRLHRRGGDVTAAHLVAAARLRAEWAAGDAAAVQPALRAVGKGAVPLLLWVAVHDRTIKDWATLPINTAAGPADPAKALGRLVVTLDWLSNHYTAAEN